MTKPALKIRDFLLLFLLAQGLPVMAQAAGALDTWRGEVAATRIQAENDMPRAYRAAQRLQATLPPDATPVDRVGVLNLLTRTEIYLAQTEIAAKHARQALDMAAQNGDRVGQAEAELNVALNSVNEARIDALVASSTHALALLDGVDRPDLLVEALLRTSMMYRRTGQFEGSVTLAMQAMEIAKRAKDPRALAYAHQGLGVSFDQSHRYAEAQMHFSQMREQARAAHSKVLEADAILGLGSVDLGLGDSHAGRRLIQEAVVLYRELGGPFYTSHGLFDLATSLRQEGRFADALPLLDEIATTYERYQNKIGLWWTLNTRSETFQSLGNLAAARRDAERAYGLAKDIGLSLYQGDSAKRMAAIYAANGDHRRAYQFSVEAAKMTAQAARDKSSDRIIQLTQRYESESRRRQIEELTRRNEQQALQQRWLWTVFGASIFLLTITTIFLLRLRRSRNEIRALNVSLEQRVQARTAELRQQASYLRTLFDTLPVSVWLKDTESRYLAINTNNASLGGPATEQMIGKTDLEIWPGDVGQSFRAADLEVMETGLRKTLEVAIPGRDGEVFWREVEKAPVIDDDGTVLGTVGIGRDISERKRYEQTLLERAELERRQSQYFAMAPGLFATVVRRVDGSYAMPFASDGIRDLLGIEPEAAMGDIASLVAVSHPDDVAMTFGEAEKSARDLTFYHIEYRIIHPQKGVRWIEVRSQPQRMPDGSVRWDGFYYDVTERKAAESALRESRQMLSEAQRIGHMGSWELDLTGNFLTWTDEIYRIFEVEREEFGASYEAFMSAVHPDDREAVGRAYTESLRNHTPFEIEHRLLFPDGRVKYVHERCETHYADDGTPLRSIGTVQDITERKQMQEALNKREQEFRALADSSPGMMGSFHLRPDGSVCMPYASPNIQELFGLTPQDIADDATSLMALNHPDDAKMVQDTIAESARTMTPWHVEFRILHPTKGERWMEGNTNPQPHPDGGVVWYGYVHDITGRKRLEEALRAREREFRSLAENSPDPIFRYDRECRRIYANPAVLRLKGLPAESLIGSAPADGQLLTDDEAAKLMAGIRRVFDSGEAVCVDLGFVDRDGNPADYQMLLVPEDDETGAVATVLGLARDITSIRGAERLMTDFVANFPGFAYTFRLSPEGHGSYPFASPGIEKLYGLLPEDVRDDMGPLHALVHPDDQPRILEAIAESARTMAPCHVEFRICRPGLPERWAEFRSVPVRAAEGGVLWHGIMLDIDERKRAEQDLKQALDFTEGIINAIPDLLFEMDRDGRYLNIWAQKSELLAAQRDVLLGRTAPEVLAPDAAAVVMSAIRAADETGLSFGKVLRLDLPRGESWFEVSVSKKLGGGLSDDRFLVLSRDITERRRLEQQLFEREQEFRALVENSPDTIARYDRDCVRIYVNPAFARLTSNPDAMLGVTPSQYYSTPQSVGYEQALRHALASGEEGEYELTWAAYDGGQITSHVRIVPERGKDGSVAGVLAVGRDITDLKRYEAAREAALAEAVRLAKLRSEFLAHMSHELRTPLNGILGYAQILQRDKAMGERNATALSVIRQSGEHLLALIDDILDLARIETGRLELVLSDIPLGKFLRVVAEIVGVKARQKGLEFSCDLSPDLPEGIRGDERRLRQVLLNLLANAVKFTDRGRVVLRVSFVTPSRLVFAVEDTGIGIAESELEKIFQAFEQTGDVQHRLGGTGLGLAISRQLVRLMGGDIRVESRPGAGSTFRFELELPPLEVPAESLSSARGATGYAGPRRKVLVVDDVAENRVIVADLLVPLGFDVVEARGGAEALELAQSTLPDLILMDIAMGEMDGKKAMRRLRRLPSLVQVPIIVLSASIVGDDEAKCLEAGANAFMPKPVDQDKLLAKIAELLRLEWTSAAPEDEAAESLIAPPADEMRALHRLAQMGNMRDILQHAEHIAGLDPSYRPFAARLRRLAESYQSKAILTFVEHYLYDTTV